MATLKPRTQVVLYDIPSRGKCTCWSLNTWKIRLMLNYKGIDYETQWVEYPDIEPHHKSLSITPAPDANPSYTIPCITFPTGESIQNSRLIAAKLESLFPTPPVRLNYAVVTSISTALQGIFDALTGELHPYVPRTILNPVSAEYFERTRGEAFGMSLEEWGRVKGGEAAWESAKEKIGALSGLVSGPWVEGEELSFADFVVVGFLKFVESLRWKEGWREC